MKKQLVPALISAFLSTVMVGCCFFGAGETKPAGLRTDQLVSPANIGAKPVFSWQMKSPRTGASQTAYRLKVFEGVKKDQPVWDSGEKACSLSVGIAYGGKELKSATKYLWEVAVRDDRGIWGEPAKGFFETGLFNASDWNGSVWITPSSKKGTMDTAAFRKVLRNARGVKEAYWTVTGLGVFEAYVNGEPVSRKTCKGTLVRDAMKPGFTHAYKLRHSFTYDVTHLMKTGTSDENVFSAFVTQGWWRDQPNGRRGKESAFRAVLILRYEDGREERFGTDTSWLSKYAGPVVQADIFNGETYDARITTEWMKSGALDGTWTASKVNTEFKGEIRPFVGTPVRVRTDLQLAPKEIYVVNGVEKATKDSFGVATIARRYKDGETLSLAPGEQLIIDFGQNAAAVPCFELEGAAGTVMTVRHAEMLNEGGGMKSRGNDGPEGTLYVDNLREAFAGIKYTLTDGRQRYRPNFTFFGYRYAGVTATAPIKILRVRSNPVTSIASKCYETGFLTTDNALVNRLISNVRWGQYSNYLSVPTDCPQRNERLGWMADTQVFTEAASYNANVYGFLRKWMRDVCDSQKDDGSYTGVSPLAQYGNEGHRVGWSDAGIIVPYTLWRQFGDTTVPAECWNSMMKYLALIDATKYASPQALEFQWADWLSYEKLECCNGTAFDPLPDGKGRRPKKDAQNYWRYLGGCYWLWDARMMAEMATALGKTADAADCRAKAARACAYLRKNFVAKDGMLIPLFRDMQTPALFALKLGLLTDEKAIAATRKGFLKNVKDHGDCLQTGFLGTSILMDTVTYDIGSPETAYTLLLQRKNPSWLYSVDQGATTIWERWNSYVKVTGFGPVGMNSFNHYAYGAVLAWMYGTMAGIQEDPSAPGFKHIVLAPIPDRRIGHVTGVYKSVYGDISSAWKYEKDGSWRWNFTIPANTTATVKVPGGETKEYVSGSYEVTVK